MPTEIKKRKKIEQVVDKHKVIVKFDPKQEVNVDSIVDAEEGGQVIETNRFKAEGQKIYAEFGLEKAAKVDLIIRSYRKKDGVTRLHDTVHVGVDEMIWVNCTNRKTLPSKVDIGVDKP